MLACPFLERLARRVVNHRLSIEAEDGLSPLIPTGLTVEVVPVSPQVDHMSANPSYTLHPYLSSSSWDLDRVDG